MGVNSRFCLHASFEGKILASSDFWRISEKSCPYPDPSLPEIENGSLEINGNRMSGGSGGYKPGSVAIYMCHSGAHLVLVPLSAGKRVCHRGRWVDDSSKMRFESLNY